MVTCKEGLCRKYANLDEDGYCPTHTRTTDLAEEENCKCGVCNELVGNNSDSKALQCDAEKCKVWYHLCCTKISEALYDLMNVNSADNDDGIRWLCPKCTGNELVISLTEKSPENIVPDCPKLKHGTCPHGITGKTEHRGKKCDFRHPKFCKKFVRNGNGGRFGCKAGNNCEFFHPILCRKSVNYRKCLDHKCTHVHLRGTARKQRKRENFPPPSQGYFNNRNAGLQQNAWYRKEVPEHSQPSKHQNIHWRQPFLDPVIAPLPSVELTSLQAQVNRLEEMIKHALNIQHQPENAQYQRNLQTQDHCWGNVGQQIHSSQPTVAHHQNY